MVTGAQLVATARTFEGEPYNQGTGRTSPTSGYKDCSGDIVAAFALLGVYGVPTVSSTQARWCYENGGLISIQEALHTPGCLLSRGRNRGMEGYGNDGHSAITIGDGVNLTEARNSRVGVLFDSYFGRQWDAGYRFPNVDYALHPVKPHKVPKLQRQIVWRRPPRRPMRGDDVLDVQTKLLAWAFITKNPKIHPGKIGDAYGRRCAKAIVAYQKAAGIPPDAIVSDPTWQSLYRI